MANLQAKLEPLSFKKVEDWEKHVSSFLTIFDELAGQDQNLHMPKSYEKFAYFTGIFRFSRNGIFIERKFVRPNCQLCASKPRKQKEARRMEIFKQPKYWRALSTNPRCKLVLQRWKFFSRSWWRSWSWSSKSRRRRIYI